MELGPAVQQTPQVDIRALTETLASLVSINLYVRMWLSTKL